MPVNTKAPLESKVPQGEGFIKSLLEPGNYTVKLLEIYLQPERNPEFGDRLIMKLETTPIGGTFRGFQIDKDDKAKGTYAGRIGNVSYSRYSYRNFTLASGDVIEKEVELQIAIRDLCNALGITKWYEDQDGKWDKPEDDMAAFIKGFNAEKPFADIWFNICISGREYMNSKYINHEMWLTQDHRTLGKGMHLDPTKVQKFFYSQHVIPLAHQASGDNQTKTHNPPVTNNQVDPPKKEAESNEDWLAAINAPVEQTYQKEIPPEQLAEHKEAKPVRAPITSQAEADFMNDKKVDTSFTDAIMNETAEDSKTDIVEGSSENPHMPWDQPQFDEWEKAHKK